MIREDWTDLDILTKDYMTEIAEKIKELDEELGFSDIEFELNNRFFFILRIFTASRKSIKKFDSGIFY